MSLKDLKKRQSGVLATKQLAGAMKTVSSIKFTRINSLWSGYGKYSEGCEKLIKSTGIEEKRAPGEKAPRLYVLISGNRGLCGGYNIELFSYFDEIVKNEKGAFFAACGKKAIEHCKQKGINLYDKISIDDIPAFEDAAALAKKLNTAFCEGKTGEVFFVCQQHINLLRRRPQTVRFLPVQSGGDDVFADETIYIPDKQTVKEKLYPFYLNTFVYSLLLNCAAGVQAATLTAMRSAYDTASESANALETEINRRRQAEVTAGVIETAAETSERESEVRTPCLQEQKDE